MLLLCNNNIETFYKVLVVIVISITLPYSNSESSLQSVFLKKMFLKVDCMDRCLVLYTCDNGTKNT